MCAYIEYIIKGFSNTQRLVGCKYTLTIGLNSNRRSSTATAGGWGTVVLFPIYYLIGFISLLPLGLHFVGASECLLRESTYNVGVISPFEPAVSALVNTRVA